jgi:hypothetical protein
VADSTISVTIFQFLRNGVTETVKSGFILCSPIKLESICCLVCVCVRAKCLEYLHSFIFVYKIMEYNVVLSFGAVKFRKQIPTFRRNIPSPCWTLKMGTACFSKTLASKRLHSAKAQTNINIITAMKTSNLVTVYGI